jgi:hypothetical protein
MPKVTKVALLLAGVHLLFLGGCATNRGVVRLTQPVPQAPAQATGKTVFIDTVTDHREFQENPSTQDIPSLGFGGSAAATVDIKKRAIARKRNTFGRALGDILLEEGQTVETVIRDALKRSFAELGYTVLGNKQDVTKGTLVVDASILKFWSYMTPGFWSIALTCDISTQLDVRPEGSMVPEAETITVKAERHFQTAGGGNWLEVMQQGLDQYVGEVKTKFAGRN